MPKQPSRPPPPHLLKGEAHREQVIFPAFVDARGSPARAEECGANPKAAGKAAGKAKGKHNLKRKEMGRGHGKGQGQGKGKGRSANYSESVKRRRAERTESDESLDRWWKGEPGH